jgi:hypothetical protein
MATRDIGRNSGIDGLFDEITIIIIEANNRKANSNKYFIVMSK